MLKESPIRYRVFLFFFILFLLGLVGRLYWLQVVEGSSYRERSNLIVNKAETIPTVRGRILSRDKDVLVTNQERLNFIWNPSEDSDPSEKLEELQTFDSIMNKPAGFYAELVNNNPEEKDVILTRYLKKIEFLPILEKKNKFPNVQWESYSFRRYLYPGLSHILGYLGQISNSELEVFYNQGYKGQSSLGKSGLEREFDLYLRGQTGLRYQKTDVSGNIIAKNGRVSEEEIVREPKKGYDLVISLDLEIQELVEKALGHRQGSAIVLKPSTGEILAMVSYPSYDSNLFSTIDEEVNRKTLLKLFQDKRSPFLNRAFQSSYAPASSFKLIMATAILEENVVSPDFKVFCPGYYMVGNRRVNCHNHDGHGYLNLKEAVAESCNVYFATIAYEHMNIEMMNRYSRAFGLGAATGVDLPGENSGSVPSGEWKEAKFNVAWNGGDTVNMSIGQGFLTTTPIQMANVVAAIVNDGVVYKPHLVNQVLDSDTGNVIIEKEPEVILQSTISPEVYREIRKIMRYTVREGSVRYVNQSRKVAYAGKTGTGEVGLDNQWSSWFISFGPYDAPPEEQVVVVTMVEATNEWEWWAPKAADIIYGGIFGDQTYEEIIQELREKHVWYVPLNA